MSHPQPTNSSLPKQRSRRGYAGWGILGLFILMLAFHRPILIVALHTAAIRVAARQNVELSFEVEGSVLTGVTLKNVVAVPTGRSPVEAISIEYLRVHYSFAQLFQYGIKDFVSGYSLRNAKLRLAPIKGTVAQKKDLAKLLREILEQPAFFSNKIQIENFNLEVKTPDGPVVVGGVHALLDPEKTGYLRVTELAIPKIATWHDIHTPATYIDRHLIARDFALGNDAHVARLEFDGSQWAKGISYLAFQGNVLGSDTELFLWRHEIDRTTTEGQLTANVSNLSLENVSKFLRWKPKVSGTVSAAWVRLSGNPDIPTNWEGAATVQGKEITVNGLRTDSVTGDLEISRGLAHLENGRITSGRNEVTVNCERRLPDSADELFTSGVEATLGLNLPDLSKISPLVSSGTLSGDARCRVSSTGFLAIVNPVLTGIDGVAGGSPFTLQSGTAQLRYEVTLHRRPPGTPWFEGIRAAITGRFVALRLGAYELDSAAASASLQENKLTVVSAELVRGANTASLSGDCELPVRAVKSLRDALFTVRGEINAPSLEAFNAAPVAKPLHGSVTASGKFSHGADGFNGEGSLEATDLAFREFAAQRVSINVPVTHNSARDASFHIVINGKDQIAGQATLELTEPYAYDARLSGSLEDLAIFQPLFGSGLSGSLDVEWHGNGKLKLLHHSGEGRLSVSKGRFADFADVNGTVAGVYSPESIDLSTFRVRSNKGAVSAGIRLRDQQLHLSDLRLEIGKSAVITGTVNFPMDLRTPQKPETVVPGDGILSAALAMEPLDIAREFPSKAQSPGAQGLVSGSLAAAGTVASPEINVMLHGRDLRLLAAKQLPPCTGAAALTFRKDLLEVNAAVAPPGSAPLQLTAAIPISLQTLLKERRVDPATPLTAAIKLPTAPAALIAQFVPQIRFAEGKISVDASVRGTLERPVLAGGAVLDLSAVRFQGSDLPGVSEFHGDLQFSDRELTVRRFQGDVAGGPFSVGGRILLDNLADPQLDLRFRSQGTLLVRNDSLTLRANSDLKINGPLNTAHVTGSIGFAQSRFFHEMEILPIGLPGRPAPKQSQGKFNFSLDSPPFRGWTFDVALKTAEPFIVRGNLANGLAYADLHLGGNGLVPTLQGSARIENFTAALPFSRLNVDYGYLYFSPDDSFDPTLDIHGTSRIRDYNINVYIYGKATEPQTLFTSEPSLPQEEVIALLATGATSREITENNQVLASRAAVLLLQDLYHKVFKRKNTTTTTAGNTPLDRFSLDVGTVDPRTGRQEVNGRFKLSDQYELGAGVDVQGDVQVQLRYLLRFR